MSGADRRQTRVLLVDDEQDLVEFLAQRLRKRAFAVHEATSGPDAVAIARDHVVEVAIVDIKMPHMDGIAVVKELHRLQPYLKAIVLTGHGSHETALEAGRLDAFRYLLKPYDFDQLVEQIEAAAAERRAGLRADFEEKLAAVLDSNASPREIMAESERLRREYEQD
jgi:two-component system NtrC family response regulator